MIHLFKDPQGQMFYYTGTSKKTLAVLKDENNYLGSITGYNVSMSDTAFPSYRQYVSLQIDKQNKEIDDEFNKARANR